MKVQRQEMANEGRVCLTHPKHGPSYVLRGGVEWCPNQEHDGGGKAKAKKTPSLLSKQVIEDDQSAQSQSA